METDNKFKPLSCQLRNKGHTLREQGHNHCECQRDMPPLSTSISEPNKAQEVQFQTQEILLFMGVQKLY